MDCKAYHEFLQVTCGNIVSSLLKICRKIHRSLLEIGEIKNYVYVFKKCSLPSRKLIILSSSKYGGYLWTRPNKCHWWYIRKLDLLTFQVFLK